MAVTAKWYGKSLEGQWSATAARRIDWVTDTINVSLHTSSEAPDQDADDFWNDVSNEITGTGYTTGGAALASKTAAYDATSNEMRLDAADTAWTTASFTARIASVYKSTGTSSTSPLVSYVDFGSDETVSSGTFTIQWDSTGVAKITAS